MDFDLGLGVAGLVGVSLVGGLLGLLLSALLLRSACDLCGVDPAPSYWRCIVTALVLAVLTAPLGYGVSLGVGAFASALHLSETAAVILAVLADVPLTGAVSTLVIFIACRVRFARAFLI